MGQWLVNLVQVEKIWLFSWFYISGKLWGEQKSGSYKKKKNKKAVGGRFNWPNATHEQVRLNRHCMRWRDKSRAAFAGFPELEPLSAVWLFEKETLRKTHTCPQSGLLVDWARWPNLTPKRIKLGHGFADLGLNCQINVGAKCHVDGGDSKAHRLVSWVSRPHLAGPFVLFYKMWLLPEKQLYGPHILSLYFATTFECIVRSNMYGYCLFFIRTNIEKWSFYHIPKCNLERPLIWYT